MCSTTGDEDLNQSKLIVNPLLHMSPFDGAGSSEKTLCELSGSRWVLSQDVCDFIARFDGRSTVAEVLGRLQAASESGPGEIPGERIASYRLLVEKFLHPRGILIAPERRVANVSQTRSRAKYLRIRVQLLSGSSVRWVARSFRWFYKAPVAALLIFAVVCAHIGLYLWVVPGTHINIGSASNSEVIYAVLIAAFVAFGHELGHATALVFCGGENPSIGWGVYVYFMVLYTDLTEAWRLGRRQRMLIDIGGMYFQGVALAILIVGYVSTRYPAILYAILLSDIDLAGNLNPFYRMDGYWLVADWLGIPDLRRRSSSLLTTWFRLGARRTPKSSKRSTDKHTAVILAVYALFTLAFFIVMGKIIVIQFLFSILPSLPSQAKSIFDLITHFRGVTLLFKSLFALFWRLTAVAGLMIFAFDLIRKGIALAKAQPARP